MYSKVTQASLNCAETSSRASPLAYAKNPANDSSKSATSASSSQALAT